MNRISCRQFKLRSAGIVLLAISLAGATPALGQSTLPPVGTAHDDVVRVETNLIQSDVMVFDKQGNFVPGLHPEQFAITVDGQTQPLSFFQQVTAGSALEQKQLAAAQRGQKPPAAAVPGNDPGAATISPGRTILFFVDDLHLSFEDLVHARTALLQFIDSQMGDDDQLAIISSSGQIGFLQQLTDNQTVLRTAVSRLNYRQVTEAYTGKTRISAYAASQIADHGDQQLFAYLMDAIKVEQQMGPGNRRGDHRLAASYSAQPVLENRVNQIDAQSKAEAANTLQALQGLVESSAALPGRKLVFFLSDGFPFDARSSKNLDQLKSVTAAAARSGTLFYSIDMRGNNLSAEVDAGANDFADFTGRQAGLAMGEESATREFLHLLADDTGGRMIASSSQVVEEMQRAVRETGNYYLLAWTLSPEQAANVRLRVKVMVKDRPDLRVRMRSDTVVAPAPAKTDEKIVKTVAGKNATPDPEVQLLTALGSVYPQRDVPLLVSAGYVGNAVDGLTLRISMQLDRNSLMVDPNTGHQEPARLAVAGAAVDDRGVIVSFKQNLTIVPGASSSTDPIVWNQQLKVPPGLYQVRIAVREAATGRTGSAQQWIEVPALTGDKLAVSSIFLGERKPETAENPGASVEVNAPRPVIVDVDHKFDRASVLRFQTYVYNATRSGAVPPDVWLEARILRNGRPVVSIAPSQLPVAGTSALPYWAEVRLDQLRSGRYVLQISATDRRAGSTAAQRIKFTVE